MLAGWHTGPAGVGRSVPNICARNRARVRQVALVQAGTGGSVATQRLFIALPCAAPAPELDAYLGTLAAMLWREVPRGQRHVTLAFLGPQPDGAVARLTQVLDPVLERQAPFSLDLAGLGAFPAGGRPTSLWTGCASGADHLEALIARLRAALSIAGFTIDRRPLRAHVTLARRRARAAPALAARAAAAWLRGGAGRTWVRLQVAQVALWRSDLEPTGARYTSLRVWSLAGRRPVP